MSKYTLYARVMVDSVLGDEAGSSLPPIPETFEELEGSLKELDKAFFGTYSPSNSEAVMSKAAHSFLIGFLLMYKSGKLNIVQISKEKDQNED